MYAAFDAEFKKMAWRNVPRQLSAVVMGSVLLGGCTSAVLQTPTLSYWDPTKKQVVHPDDFSKDTHTGKAVSRTDRNQFSESYALTFAKTEDTDREGVDNEFYFHPLPYNLEHYSEVGRKWTSGSTKDGETPYWKMKDFRNFVQNDLLRRSDQICSAYLTRIVHGFAVGSAVGKTAKSAFGVLQTLAAPASFVSDTIQVGGAGITGLGTTEILQYKVFSDTSQSILKSRRAIRNAIRSAQRDDIATYDISQALYDAERYHTVCNYATQWAAGPDIATSENEVIIAKAPVPETKEPDKPKVDNKNTETAPNVPSKPK